ncbi:hypothetical protein Cylst_3317 [Cylindrospermum stagnale PCC 7417]|uniref:Uncharacterized protein n=1 Tax=Cylindrospermum stagnale PCC 7417 TaxID=56107 RepID=K9X069_9NOST|nr:hypothetical protein [Cylindrospermum stagnale]AFZ25469.1 hypothetical protein Cylst_3317 [Cylindrospermum stagnale PCC 7417]
MKSSLFRNFAVTACSLGLLGSLVGCLGMSVSFESTNPEGSSPTSTESHELQRKTDSPVTPANAISASASTPINQVDLSTRKNSPALLAYRFDSADKAKTQGTLRMSNRTNQPVRLALLARQPAVKGGDSQKTHNDIPAHWDFAPQEGSQKGLVLSLPQGNLKLSKGDILVAFAQDGTRRYWGPYVVGETPSPARNPQNQEWQLVLNP